MTLSHQSYEAPGLILISTFVDDLMGPVLVKEIDSQPWDETLARRTQQYGYSYDYKGGSVKPTAPMPGHMMALGEFITDQYYPDTLFNQAIVNEYLPGQGIGPHIDANVFGGTVASLSLLSDIVMNFEKEKNIFSLALLKDSLLILQGPARYEWKHGISKTKYDFAGKRSRRISITYREVL